MYVEMLVTNTFCPFSLPHSTLREGIENINKGMAQHSQLALPVVWMKIYGAIMDYFR